MEIGRRKLIAIPGRQSSFFSSPPSYQASIFAFFLFPLFCALFRRCLKHEICPVWARKKRNKKRRRRNLRPTIHFSVPSRKCVCIDLVFLSCQKPLLQKKYHGSVWSNLSSTATCNVNVANKNIKQFGPPLLINNVCTHVCSLICRRVVIIVTPCF